MSPGAVVKRGIDGLESSFPEWLGPTAVDLRSTALVSSPHYAFLQSKPPGGQGGSCSVLWFTLETHTITCAVFSWSPWFSLSRCRRDHTRCEHQSDGPLGPSSRLATMVSTVTLTHRWGKDSERLVLEGWRPSKEPADWMQCCLAPRLMFISTCNRTWFHGVFWCMY